MDQGRSVGGEPRHGLDAGRQLGRCTRVQGCWQSPRALDLADLGLSAESVRSVQWDHQTPNNHSSALQDGVSHVEGEPWILTLIKPLR